jgi:1,4-alpha-glucan branching enzyme
MNREATTALDRDELARLVAGEHPDPHRLLGMHEGQVRALWPGAEGLALVLAGGKRKEMERLHDAGVFAARLDGAAARPGGTRAGVSGQESPYLVEARFRDGTTQTYEDPYRFWPTLGEVDLHLIGEGRHHRLWEALGAHYRNHQGVWGTAFAVWAPTARSVRVVGDWNHWDGRRHPMRVLASSGVWEVFLPGVEPGYSYQYEILTAERQLRLKADPLAREAEVPPGTASVVPAASAHSWQDGAWMEARREDRWHERPVSVYEVHLGSWRRVPEEGDRPLTYRELARALPEYVASMGFTHVELMPVAEHPFGGSWGYQVSSYYAPTSRHGDPDGLRELVDACHRRGIGVIVDWVPAHFPRDDWALARFDGSALYEHADPRQGSHPDWGTLVFNFGRHEVRNFLIANALYWLEEFHIDGLRVDAVASMLYLDYSRKEGEWVPNAYGGRENLDAVGFLKEMNETVYASHPGVVTVAEESTAWPAVSRPVYLGGLGFGFKWNMGWMHDTLEYFGKEPIYRRYHHNSLTFGLLYAFSENFILPLSHDEVVHGKGSLLSKMPGDEWQKLANLRSLFAWMWAHPGKQLLFMGGELGQWREWYHDASLDWHLLADPRHRGLQALVRDLNRLYADHGCLWERDSEGAGFRWIDASDVDSNVLSFLRLGSGGGGGSPVPAPLLACVANLSPIPRHGYRVGLPAGGTWREALNTDALVYGGSGVGNGGAVWAADASCHGLAFSAELTLPPLGVLWLVPEGGPGPWL